MNASGPQDVTLQARDGEGNAGAARRVAFTQR